MKTKGEQIGDIMRNRPMELLREALWDDPVITGRICSKLQKVETENMKYHHAHFCDSKKVII